MKAPVLRLSTLRHAQSTRPARTISSANQGLYAYSTASRLRYISLINVVYEFCPPREEELPWTAGLWPVLLNSKNGAEHALTS